MPDIVFLDTETIGLHPDAPIWEFAAIRRYDIRFEQQAHLFIKHDPQSWADIPEQFQTDYLLRYNADYANSEYVAACVIHSVTKNAHVIGAVPNFDTERLAKLLQRNRLEPEWHYHLIDVENLAVGYLAAKGEPMAPPWKSDALSAAIGVDPAQFDRHTAMGDVLWVRAQYDAIMGGEDA